MILPKKSRNLTCTASLIAVQLKLDKSKVITNSVLLQQAPLLQANLNSPFMI